MTAYYAIYAWLVGQGFFSIGRPAARRFFYWLGFGILFIFVTLRWEVGCDWRSYNDHFELTAYQPLEFALSRREPGYWTLLYVVHSAGLDFVAVNVIMGAIFFFGLHGLAKRQPDPLAFVVLSLPVLIINLPMSALRQGAAVGFLCLAYCAFIDRRPWKYVVLVLIGSLFHSSVLIFSALAPFVWGGLTARNMLLSIVLSAPGLYFLFLDDFELYTERYIESDIDAAGGIFRCAMLGLVAILFFVYFRRPWRERFPRDYDLVLIGSFIMLAAFAAIFVSSVVGDRIGYYILPLQLVILARFPYLYEGRDRALLVAAPYAGLGLVLVVWSQFSKHFNLCYVPYQSVLF